MTVVLWGGQAARREALEEELSRLHVRLREIPGVMEAWVFGSVVTGGVHATSDLDLLVIRETPADPVERGLDLVRELQPRVPIDVFVYTPSEASAGGRFVDDVRRRGRRIL